MTNRDKINGMDNEEMAEFLSGMMCEYCPLTQEVCSKDDYYAGCGCAEALQQWLEIEVDG